MGFSKNISAYTTINEISNIPVCAIAQYMRQNRFSRDTMSRLLKIDAKRLNAKGVM